MPHNQANQRVPARMWQRSSQRAVNSCRRLSAEAALLLAARRQPRIQHKPRTLPSVFTREPIQLSQARIQLVSAPDPDERTKCFPRRTCQVPTHLSANRHVCLCRCEDRSSQHGRVRVNRPQLLPPVQVDATQRRVTQKDRDHSLPSCTDRARI